MNKLDWESFKPKFHESWHRWMQPAIESEWMWNIYMELKKCKDIVLPASKDTFNSFICHFDDIKCVLVSQD